MDSKDDIYDAHRLYSSDYDDEEEEESMDNYFDDSDTKVNADVDARADSLCIEEDFYPSGKNYIVLKEGDVRQRMEDNITEVSDVLSIPKPEASIVLRHYNWSVSKVNDAWFVDEYGVREKVGLFDKPVIQLPSKSTRKLIICGICLESYGGNRFCWASCGHTFCSDCFASLINVSINDGVRCLMLRCPEPSCNAAIGQDMIDKLASEESKDKYSRYLIRSYIENNKKIKWCPAPGCDYAVDFDVGGGSFDVSCLCFHRFCWNCIEEAHRPVDCDTVAKWILKNKSDAENTNWILIHTKPCPKCKRPIEKNQGCMHMTCTKTCRFEFCWVCLQDWHGHASRACNRYREDHAKVDRAKELAAKHLERYAHYYERWAANEVSMKKAFADLQQVQSMHIEKLCHYQCQTEGQLKFITEAWQQIVECRRILKWTYAYGYYLPMDEPAKIQFFEYSQDEAERALERLHHCAEKEVEVFLDADHSPSQKFNGFRSKLAGLTQVTKTFFDNLVNALENGLSDVVGSSKKGRKLKEYVVDVAGSSKKRKKSKEYVVESATAQDTSRNFVVTTSSTNVVDYTAQEPWTCEYCSYANDNTAMACQMCNQGSWSCDYCTYVNLRNATECEVCNEPR